MRTFAIGTYQLAAMLILACLSWPWLIYALGVEAQGGDFLEAFESSPAGTVGAAVMLYVKAISFGLLAGTLLTLSLTALGWVHP